MAMANIGRVGLNVLPAPWMGAVVALRSLLLGCCACIVLLLW
ncbi:hypothetical protein PCL1606_06210 [Pseudomonas chlororaphis]|uniref:Uncharacterized protein n=1 Tax=Pseudomonas chlororaphis TaxID=587753 RepID=A0A0D5XTK9_9PSED|nr:hypothetical protein PCL1606_06210 [Pseudomonas chlororaphis]